MPIILRLPPAQAEIHRQIQLYFLDQMHLSFPGVGFKFTSRFRGSVPNSLHVARSDVGLRCAASMVAIFGGVGMGDTPRALRDRFCQTWRATQRAVDVEEVVLLAATVCREVLVPDQWQSAIQRFSQFSSAVGCSCIARARRLRLPCVARKTGSRPTKPPVGAPWLLRGSFAAPVGESGHSSRFLGI